MSTAATKRHVSSKVKLYLSRSVRRDALERAEKNPLLRRLNISEQIDVLLNAWDLLTPEQRMAAFSHVKN